MKLKTLITWTAALVFTCGAARAAHIWEDPSGWGSTVFVSDVEGPRYSSQELSLDMFGSYIAGEHHLTKLFETDIRSPRGRWGGGAGLNYFFTREIGIGADMNIADNGGPFIDHVLGNLILRWPIDPSGFAPYIFGGGGRGFDIGWTRSNADTDGFFAPGQEFNQKHWEWLADLGVGVEYRLNPATGVFVDGRYIWHDQTGSTDRLLLRGGLRLVF